MKNISNQLYANPFAGIEARITQNVVSWVFGELELDVDATILGMREDVSFKIIREFNDEAS